MFARNVLPAALTTFCIERKYAKVAIALQLSLCCLRIRVAVSMTRAATSSSRRRKLGRGERRCLGGRLLDGPQEPVGSGVEDELHRVRVG
jgi:hypothetical protein